MKEKDQGQKQGQPEGAVPGSIDEATAGLTTARRAVTTAMEHVSSGSGDDAAAIFLEELDMLAEMTLRLQRRVDEISDAR